MLAESDGFSHRTFVYNLFTNYLQFLHVKNNLSPFLFHILISSKQTNDFNNAFQINFFIINARQRKLCLASSLLLAFSFLFPDTNPIGSHRKSKQDSRELYQNFCLLQQKTVEFGTISLYI